MRNLPFPTRLLPLCLLGVAGLALAGSWGDFKAAFPGLPCQDGWAGCIVDGSPVSPGMVLDDKGRPHPANMRLGFFDFDPLPSLSPFAPLSNYTGSGVESTADGAGDAAGTDRALSADAGRGHSPGTRDDGAKAQRGLARQAVAAERAAEDAAAAAAREANQRARSEAQARAAQETARKAADEAATAAASAKDDASRAAAQKRADEAQQAADAAARQAEQDRLAADAARQAAAQAARQAAEEQARQDAAAAAAAAANAQGTTPANASDGDAVAMSETPPSSQARSLAPASCDNLVALEVPAMMGQLGTGVRACLEKSLAATASQTGKGKISRVLIADAEARRDQKDWESLMKRHLQDIDRSDPNLCFKYALHLSRGGASRAFGVIRWADYALENKQRWSGAAYTKNVSGLYKIRAQAANKLWQNAEKKLVDDRSDENEAAAEKYRGQTKDYAREWLDYARAAGQNTSTAMALCVSAAGNKEFCSG